MRILSAFCILVLLGLVLMATTPFSLCQFLFFVNAQRMTVTQEINPTGSNQYLAASVLDTRPAHKAVYFGTGIAPGTGSASVVCKYSLVNGNFQQSGACVPHLAERSNFRQLMIDEHWNFLYAAAQTRYNDKAWICKYHIYPTVTVRGCAEADATSGFVSGVINPGLKHIIVGTMQNQLCRYDASDPGIDATPLCGSGPPDFTGCCISIPPQAGRSVTHLQAAAIDGVHQFAYFGSLNGFVCQINFAAFSLSGLQCVEGQFATDSYTSAAMHWPNRRLYFGTSNSRVCGFTVTSTNPAVTFAYETCTRLPGGSGGFPDLSFNSAIIDPAHDRMYVGTNTPQPSFIFRVKVSGSLINFETHITPTNGKDFASAVIDLSTSPATGYFGSYDLSGSILKVCLPPDLCGPGFTCPGCTNVPCPLGHECPSGGMTSPSICPNGTYQDQTQQEECKDAPPGTFAPDSGMTHPINCSAGEEQPLEAQTKCDPCQPGRWSVERSANCKVCPKGYFCPFVRTSFPAPCPYGYWSSATSATSNATCNECSTLSTNVSDGAEGPEWCEPTPTKTIEDTGSPSMSQNDSLSISFSASNNQSSSMSISNTDEISNSSTISLPNTSTISTSFSRSKNESLSVSETASTSASFSSSKSPTKSPSPSETRSETATIAMSPSQSENETVSAAETESTSSTFSSSKSPTKSPSPSEPRSETPTIAMSPSQSENATVSASETASTSASRSASESSSSSLSPSPSLSSTKSLSSSTSSSNSISSTASRSNSDTKILTCYNFDQQTCVQYSNECQYCSEQSVCRNLTTSKSCDCVSFNENTCDAARPSCNYCRTEEVCVPAAQKCGCLEFSPTLSVKSTTDFCTAASTACHFCKDQDICLPKTKSCNCESMTKSQCMVSNLSTVSTSCYYCKEINYCAPKGFDCKCMSFPDESSCGGKSGCQWCSTYGICTTDNWGCNCANLPNSKECNIFSSEKCQWCGKEEKCADPSFNCECERFDKAMCDTSKCIWCRGKQTCTVAENPKCECYYFRTEDRCNSHTGGQCSWCASATASDSYDEKNKVVTDGGSKTFPEISNFNYCIDKATDKCECAYLSPEFCKLASATATSSSSPTISSPTTTNYSTSCKYCSSLDLCTHPENRKCLCGDEYSKTGCDRSPACSWKEEVLTIEEAVPYCGKDFSRAASGSNNNNNDCDPVTCEGIQDGASCNASGCKYNVEADRCEATVCFNFFVKGFSPQPFTLYFFGLFKDALVVLLLGAIGDTLTRPVMNIVLRVKRRIKQWSHINPRINEATLFMSDKICRDGYSFSFNEYVEMIHEDTFEFVDDDGNSQVLDEAHRLKLFDITAFCLFDNMLWIEPESGSMFHQSENNTNTNNDNSNDIPYEQEMTSLPSANRDEAVAVSNETEEMNGDEKEDTEKDKEEEEEGKNKRNVMKKEEQNQHEMMYSPREEEEEEEKKEQPPTSPETNNDSKQQSLIDQNKKEDSLVHEKKSSKTNKKRSASIYEPPSSDPTTTTAKGEKKLSSAHQQHHLSVSFAARSLSSNNHEVVQLKASDFESLSFLRNKVEDALVERACEFIYYSQSRNLIIKACASINSFPTAIQLLYYTVAVAIFYGTSLAAVRATDNIHRMVEGCDPTRTNNGDNSLNISSSSSNNNNSTLQPGGGGDVESDLFSATFMTGAFLLLGFRLMNSSVQATGALIFVKTVRGLYQRYYGLYDLTMQQRIPLMGLYADRPVQITLAVYGFFILPFALSGLIYGGIFVNWRCVLPPLVGCGLLVVNCLVLMLFRWLAVRKRMIKDQRNNRMLSLQKIAIGADDLDEKMLEENEKASDSREEDSLRTSNETTQKDSSLSIEESVLEEFEKILDDDSPVQSVSAKSLRRRATSAASGEFSLRSSPSSSPPKRPSLKSSPVVKNHKKKKADDFINNGKRMSPKNDDDDKDQEGSKNNNNNNNNDINDDNGDDSSSSSSTDEDFEMLAELDEKVAAQTSITSSAPMTLGRAIIVFMMTEEIPTLIVALALQISVNYLCLLKFSYAFGIRDNYELVHEKDFDGRRLICVWEGLKEDASGFMSVLSSFVPFM